MNNRVIITGGTGLLGKALIESADKRSTIAATYTGSYCMQNTSKVEYFQLDITDEEGNRKLFKMFRPDVVVHAAGINNPDYVEGNRDMSWAINVNGTKNILNLCSDNGAKFIYISSNAIYDGNNAPYKEEDGARPINYYGYIKLECEKIVKESNVQNTIVRPILMYGWNNPKERDNIVTITIDKLSRNENMAVYSDVYSNPLLSDQCAESIWEIIEGDHFNESFNIAGGETSSIYEFIRKTAKIFELDDKLLIPVKQGYFKNMVLRPRDTSYCTSKMEKLLGIKPLSLNDGLMRMKRDKI